jgi:uncharacterized protein
MTGKPGRNDPCPCGSGKKYKNCCITKEQKGSAPKPLSARKFTAKVLSAPAATPEQHAAREQDKKAAMNYSTLMERSFGSAIHKEEEKPPVPTSPTEFLVDKPKEK